MTEEQIFLAALELPDVRRRTAYLDSVCGTDAALRRHMEELLAAHFKSGAFLDEPLGRQLGSDSANSNYAETVLTSSSSAEVAVANEKGTEQDSDELPFLSPSTRADSLGRIGHYEVLQVLGKGGFGIVFRAFDEALQRVVALKVLAPTIAATSPARKRFLREAQSSARIRHENVVQVYAVQELPVPYLVMEFIAGETLQHRLDRKGPLDVAEIVSLARQIAAGLAAAHETGLIHRDIKPGNILIEGGVQGRVKITDFGLARAADDASMTQSGMLAGTPMFMAPEQAQGETLDQRADLFSLGSVLYVMASGRPPFRAATTFAVLKRVVEETPRPIRDLIPETPQWLCDIIAKLHAKKPADRFQSALEVADVLANCEQQLKTDSKLRDFSRIPKRKPVPRAKGTWKWVAAAALMMALFGLGWFVANSWLRPTIHRDDDRWVAIADGDNVADWGRVIDPDGDCRIQKMGDRVRITAPTKHDLSGWYKIYNAPRLVREVNGDFRARVRIRPFADVGMNPGRPAQPYLTGSLLLWGDEEHFARIDRALQFESDMGGRNLRHDVVAFHSASQPLERIPADLRRIEPNGPSHLELERRGDVVTVRTSIDGRNWSAPLRLPPLDLPETVKVGVAAVCMNSSEPHRVEFEGFEIMPLKRSPEEGFVQLFNGQDLTGWKTHPEQTGEWKVKDGVLVGSNVASYLFSDADQFENFHLRVEAKINRGGDSGIFFRAPFAMRPGRVANSLRPAGGYEVELHRSPGHQMPTGSLWNAESSGPPKVLSIPADGSLTKDDEWFVLEIIAQGNHFITKVNGTRTADCHDRESKFRTGHFALQALHPQTVVQFRKIEIKELPASAPESPPSTFTNGIGMKFVVVPKGKSWLGGGKDKPGDLEVEFPADFYLGKYEVTQEEWEKVMGKNPSAFSRKSGYKDAVKDISDADLKQFPVEDVSIDRCLNFVDKLNKLEKDPEWYYRLPTELEREYACRGGPMSNQADSAFDFYFARPTNTLLAAQANFDNELKRPRKVGSYEPNALGICDMHGNVEEWCEEWAVRGGGFQAAASDCRAENRWMPIDGIGSFNLGLRLARVRFGTPAPEVKTSPTNSAPPAAE